MALRLIFEAKLLDPSESVHHAAECAWRALLGAVPTSQLAAAAEPQLEGWLHMLCTPLRAPLPPLDAERVQRPDGGPAAIYNQLPHAAVTDGMHERGATALATLAHACSAQPEAWLSALQSRCLALT